MDETNGTGVGTEVYSKGATSELDERLGKRLASMDTAGVYEAGNAQPQGGFGAYVGRNITSKVVQIGLVGLLAFGAGAKYHDTVADSYNKTKQFAGECMRKGSNYVANALISRMSPEQKQQLLRDNMKKMSTPSAPKSR